MALAAETAAAAVPERPSATEIKTARAKAEQLVADQDSRAGMKDLQNLTQAIGLPAARVLLRQLLDAGDTKSTLRSNLLSLIQAISPITEPGCMKVDFFNMETKVADTVYLELDECDKTHDLDSQLNKLKPHVGPDKWPTILHHLSVLVGIGRSVFAAVAHTNEQLMRELHTHLPEIHRKTDLRHLTVDRLNTTLYLIDTLPKRVGIFIRRKGDEKT